MVAIAIPCDSRATRCSASQRRPEVVRPIDMATVFAAMTAGVIPRWVKTMHTTDSDISPDFPRTVTGPVPELRIVDIYA